jgi:anti-sigma-K factor RskA
MNEEKKERLFELLADQTMVGLNEEELMELKQLKIQFPDWENDLSFELAAAAIGLTNLDTKRAVPASLRARVLADADKFFNPTEETQEVKSFAPRKNVGSLATESVGSIVEVESKRPIWQWLGWAVAAAACVALAFNIWLTRVQPNTEIVKQPERIQTPTPELSAAQKRAEFLVSATDVITKNWKSPKDAGKILGDIVWSNSQQKGYLRFRGLPANNPTKECYQLWIVDETQDKKTPISGGVFDIAENGETIIPIDAQLEIKKPIMFAITKEKPGGVVVSKPDRIVAVAKV